MSINKLNCIYNEEAERSLVVQIIIQPKNLEFCSIRLPIEAFSNDVYRELYATCLRFRNDIDRLKLDELAVEIQRKVEPNQNVLANLENFLNQGASMGFNEAIKKVELTFVRRKIIDILELTQENILTSFNIEETVSQAYSNIFKELEIINNYNKQVDQDKELNLLIEDLTHDKDFSNVIKSGFKNLDQLISGFQRGHVGVIASRPSMGKTSFACNLINNFMSRGLRCLLFSLETSQRFLFYKMISLKSGFDYNFFHDNQIAVPNHLKERFNKAIEKVSYYSKNSYLRIFDSVYAISEMIFYIKQAKNTHGLDVVVIDYLQIMNINQKKSYYLEFTEIMNRLKAIAKSENVSIIVLSQLSRNVDNRDSKWPQLSDLSYSGGIEMAADLICMLYRPEYYLERAKNKVDQDKNLVYLIIVKNRNGKVGHVKQHFNAQLGLFVDVEVEEIEG